jgi:hypothetical protein
VFFGCADEVAFTTLKYCLIVAFKHMPCLLKHLLHHQAFCSAMVKACGTNEFYIFLAMVPFEVPLIAEIPLARETVNSLLFSSFEEEEANDGKEAMVSPPSCICCIGMIHLLK